MQSKKQYVKIIISIFQSPFLFFNLLFKKTLIPTFVKRVSPFVLNKKGFTVIGVLVASAIGLIVVTGLSQMFSNIHTQLRQMEQKSQKIFLNDFIGSQLKTGCTKTLESLGRRIIQGSNIDFLELKDETNQVILDLDDPAQKEELKAKYGITRNTYFQLRCSDSPDCNCNGKSSPCNRKWTLSFISQSELNGLPVYNKNFSVELGIKYPLLSSRTLTSGDGNKLSCNVFDITYSAAPSTPSLDCIRTDKTNNLALIGCGTTTQVTESSTTAYGYNAGSSSSTGINNTFIGYEAGQSSTGHYNTFIGYNTGSINSVGTYNTLVGYMAGKGGASSIFYRNTFIGFETGKSSSTSFRNTFIGFEAGKSNSTGHYNTFIGYEAGQSNSTGWGSTFIGYESGQSNSTGYRNTFIGKEAGLNNSIGDRNTFIGKEAGFNNGTGQGNTFIGYEAGKSNSTGDYNTFIGKEAGLNNSIGEYNTFIGFEAGKSNTRSRNTFIGFEAGKSSSTGWSNTFIGSESGKSNSTGRYNTFIGKEAGLNNSIGRWNTFVGAWAGKSNSTGWSNTFIGYNVGANNSTGDYNTFIGFEAGKSNSTGYINTFVGYNVGANNSTGQGNTFIGNYAGDENTSGSGNIFIGFHAADTLDYKTDSNKFVIGNDSRVAPPLPSSREWIVGDIGTDTFEINGKQVCFARPCTPSSRVLKKNIQPDRNFDKVLEDILKTPLFTYEYKDKQNHPEKSRMGIIAEELPPHLRLKDKKGLAYPDWPSIYGTFWAGIKALHEIIADLKQDISSKDRALGSRLEQGESRRERFENKQAQLNRELSAEIKPSTKAFAQSLKHFKEKVFLKFKTLNRAFPVFKEELSLKLKVLTFHVGNLGKQLEGLIREFSQFRTELADLKKHFEGANKDLAWKTKQFSKELARVKIQLSEANKGPEQDSQGRLAKAKKALEQNHKEIQDLKKQISKICFKQGEVNGCAK